MPSRRDQIQSYQFAVQRVVSALVAREADPGTSPLRRLVGAAFASVMVGVLALAAVGVFGIITGRSGASWRDGSAVILERESGAAFVYREGRLIPAANFASALLLLQSAPRTVTVPRAQLAGEPRGLLAGIPNAPDALPDPKRLLTGAWTLCTSIIVDSRGRSTASTSMLVGAGPSAGRAIGDDALIVKLRDSNTLYLVWRQHRHRIVNNSVVLEALALRQEPQLEVGAAWLNALPEGDQLQTIGVSGRGRLVSIMPELPDLRAGQVLLVQAGGDAKQHYLVFADRLRPITEVEAAIVLADPATRTAYQGEPHAREVSASAVAATRPAAAAAPAPDSPPQRRPRMTRQERPDAALCSTFTDASGTPRIVVDAVPQPSNVGMPTAAIREDGVVLVDRVVVEAGRGAVVEVMSAPGKSGGSLFLVTDLGVRYGVPSHDVLTFLGYGSAKPVRLPASLVVRLPEGPALDPTAAAKPIRVE